MIGIHESEILLEENSATKKILRGKVEGSLDAVFQNINLDYSKHDVDYVDFISWVEENIESLDVAPLIANVAENPNIESIISRVKNVINGRGFNGTLEIGKTEILTDTPLKTSVEVQLF